MKRFLSMICTLVFFFTAIPLCNVEAVEIAPRADSEFASITISLKSSKQVSFRAIANDIKKQIKVTACWLERKNADDTWSNVGTLTPPGVIAENAFTYSATVNYSSNIGSGTYRVGATFDADGHSVSRYSNERSY